MWDVDSGNMPININHYWKDPLDNGRQTSPNPFVVKAALIFIVIALAALVLFVKGGFTPATLDKIILVIAIIAVLAFIKIFNINIFNNPFVQKVLLFVGLGCRCTFRSGWRYDNDMCNHVICALPFTQVNNKIEVFIHYEK